MAPAPLMLPSVRTPELVPSFHPPALIGTMAPTHMSTHDRYTEEELVTCTAEFMHLARNAEFMHLACNAEFMHLARTAEHMPLPYEVGQVCRCVAVVECYPLLQPGQVEDTVGPTSRAHSSPHASYVLDFDGRCAGCTENGRMIDPTVGNQSAMLVNSDGRWAGRS